MPRRLLIPVFALAATAMAAGPALAQVWGGHMMAGSGAGYYAMAVGMGLFWVVAFGLLVLAIVALIKYIFSG